MSDKKNLAKASTDRSVPKGERELDPELIETIRKEAQSVSYAIINSEYHSGPMPSPKQLAEYEEVLPGLADEIRNEFLLNGQHIRELEAKAIEFKKDDNDKNRRVAERLVWGSLLISAGLALTGHDWVAGVIAAATVAAVVTGFISNRVKKVEDKSK